MNSATLTTSAFPWHQAAIRRVLEIIFVYAGLVGNAEAARQMLAGNSDETAPARAFRAFVEPFRVVRRTHRLIAKWLLPAESATRRLILAMAVHMPRPKLRPAEIKRLTKPAPPFEIIRLTHTHDANVMVPRFIFHPPKPPPGPPKRMPRFCLFDQQKRFGRRRTPARRPQPRIWFADSDRPPVPALRPRQTELDLVSDRSLMRRLAALSAALDDLPREAQRLALWRARYEVLTSPHRAATSPSRGEVATRSGAGGGGNFRHHRPRRALRQSPLRVGMPPGSAPYRLPKDQRNEAHKILVECHSIAWESQWRPAPDTS